MADEGDGAAHTELSVAGLEVAGEAGRFDLNYPVWGRLREFWSVALDGFTIAAVSDEGDGTVELLTCAHLGLTALYLGDLESARGAARALRRFLDLQPSPETRFYLRLAAGGVLQTDFPAEAAGLHVVDTGRRPERRNGW